jgi:hypothetical protein
MSVLPATCFNFAVVVVAVPVFWLVLKPFLR